MATSDKNIVNESLFRMLTAAVVLGLLACATAQAQSADAGTASDQAADAQAVKPEMEIAEPFEGEGLEIPVDGSSLEAFNASLAMIKEHTSKENYKSLENAIGYLLIYDLSAKRSEEKLAANLDGLNGYEIMDKVGWRKPPAGKSKIEKDSADAKLIDT
jgi:hypothetical protein